jgi:hypothetical protein
LLCIGRLGLVLGPSLRFIFALYEYLEKYRMSLSVLQVYICDRHTPRSNSQLVLKLETRLLDQVPARKFHEAGSGAFCLVSLIKFFDLKNLLFRRVNQRISVDGSLLNQEVFMAFRRLSR